MVVVNKSRLGGRGSRTNVWPPSSLRLPEVLPPVLAFAANDPTTKLSSRQVSPRLWLRLLQSLLHDFCRGEYFCPLCRQLANSVLPLSPQLGDCLQVVKCKPADMSSSLHELSEFLKENVQKPVSLSFICSGRNYHNARFEVHLEYCMLSKVYPKALL